MNQNSKLICYYLICIITILSIIAALISNILIGCEIIFHTNHFFHSYIFYFIRIIKWVGIVCLFFFYIKLFWINFRIKIIKKSCVFFIPLFLCYAVLYYPLYFFTFSNHIASSMIVWIILDFIAIMLILLSLSDSTSIKNK
jgi:hypothetical protein